MLKPGLNSNANTYRYGYNGKEMDNDVKGTGNSYDFGARIYDPRLGRWWSMDMYADITPAWTPYRFGYDNPIYWIDKDGNIEAPLKGTVVYHENSLVKVDNDFLVREKVNGKTQYVSRDQFTVKAMSNMGNETKTYNFAYRRIGDNPMNKTQMAAKKAGTLITINSEFFKERQIGSCPHVGIDYVASYGTNVYSYGDGKVIFTGDMPGYGKSVIIEYANGDRVQFTHLSDYGELEVGKPVYEGQIIGKSGDGNGDYAAHLHVTAVDKNGVMVDPSDRIYGTITNEEFFNQYGGDYKKLKEAKENKMPTEVSNNNGNIMGTEGTDFPKL
jgi:RHS repeat-associated protein